MKEKIEKAINLANSRQLDFYKVSDSPQIKTVVEHVFSEMTLEGLVPSQKTYADNLLKSLGAIILDLYSAHQSDPSVYLSYSRDNSYYGKSRYIPSFISISNIKKVTGFLINRKYIEHHLGYNFPNNKKRSRMKATDKLIQPIENKNVSKFDVKPDENEEILILKDRKKRVIDYKDTEETVVMRENLRKINSALEDCNIIFDIFNNEIQNINKRMRNDPDKCTIDFTRKRLKRIFNNKSWKEGGRFYGGWWQQIPKEYRPYILFDDGTDDGLESIELDYSGLHIYMLYAKEKLPLPEEDPYSIEEYPESRDFLKSCLQIIINSISRKNALTAIQKEINFRKIDKPYEVKSLGNVIDKFTTKHSPIKKYFYSGEGINLQYLDSVITEKILLYFSETMFPVLPIHDSFITIVGLKETLENVMDQEFYIMFEMQCHIKSKVTATEDRVSRMLKNKGMADYFRKHPI